MDNVPDASRDVQVRMCQLAVGSGQDVLRTILGSCVGIGLLWRERSVYGLAHCLLPQEPPGFNAGAESGAKYVTQAIPSLLSMMQAKHAARGEIEAVLAGGANMVNLSPPPRHGPIGEQNVRTAQRLLEALGMRIVHLDVGGECGRQLSIDCAQHQYAVKRIARPF